ncbi:hypothetical protein MMC25_006746 [Agyrium rufum]|nr:hypothetical protein [Agyrium rufum]
MKCGHNAVKQEVQREKRSWRRRINNARRTNATAASNSTLLWTTCTVPMVDLRHNEAEAGSTRLPPQPMSIKTSSGWTDAPEHKRGWMAYVNRTTDLEASVVTAIRGGGRHGGFKGKWTPKAVREHWTSWQADRCAAKVPPISAVDVRAIGNAASSTAAPAPQNSSSQALLLPTGSTRSERSCQEEESILLVALQEPASSKPAPAKLTEPESVSNVAPPRVPTSHSSAPHVRTPHVPAHQNTTTATQPGPNKLQKPPPANTPLEGRSSSPNPNPIQRHHRTGSWQSLPSDPSSHHEPKRHAHHSQHTFRHRRDDSGKALPDTAKEIEMPTAYDLSAKGMQERQERSHQLRNKKGLDEEATKKSAEQQQFVCARSLKRRMGFLGFGREEEEEEGRKGEELEGKGKEENAKLEKGREIQENQGNQEIRENRENREEEKKMRDDKGKGKGKEKEDDLEVNVKGRKVDLRNIGTQTRLTVSGMDSLVFHF